MRVQDVPQAVAEEVQAQHGDKDREPWKDGDPGRREELLADPKTVAAKQQLRRGLVGLPTEKAMDTLLTQLRRTKTNADLLAAVA